MTQWRGREVPDTIAAWFDQLMDPVTLAVVQVASSERYIDVILTVSPMNGVTRVPDIITKGAAKEPKRQIDSRRRPRVR